MGKVISNGEEVVPAKKIKLFKFMSKKDIKKMLKEKQLEMREKREKDV